MKTLSEIETEAILYAIEFCRGDKPEAARQLGIGKTTMYRKLKEQKLALPLYQARALRRDRLTDALLQATVLRFPPKSYSNGGYAPLRTVLLLPSTRAEILQANLRCPSCQSRLLEGRK